MHDWIILFRARISRRALTGGGDTCTFLSIASDSRSFLNRSNERYLSAEIAVKRSGL